jgi:hypothetical protein
VFSFRVFAGELDMPAERIGKDCPLAFVHTEKLPAPKRR